MSKMGDEIKEGLQEAITIEKVIGENKSLQSKLDEMTKERDSEWVKAQQSFHGDLIEARDEVADLKIIQRKLHEDLLKAESKLNKMKEWKSGNADSFLWQEKAEKAEAKIVELEKALKKALDYLHADDMGQFDNEPYIGASAYQEVKDLGREVLAKLKK